MRVLVNHLFEPPARVTGVTRYAFALMRGLLASARHDYVLATSWRAEDLPADIRDRLAAVETRAPIAQAALQVGAQSLLIPSLMRRHRCDVVFHPTPIGSFLDGAARVVTIHDLYYKTAPKEYPQRHVQMWDLLMPRILRQSRRIIAVSQATADDIAQFYPSERNKIRVVHEAPAMICAPGSNDNAAPFALIVGNVAPNKNYGLVVAACAELARRGRPLELRHIGSGDTDALRAAAQQHGADVRLMGVQSDEALCEALRTAIAVVIPSLREGFCLPLVEAQTAGAAVLCSDIPVLREVAGDGALFFDPLKVDSLADALAKVRDDDARSALRARSLANAARFSWARAAAETEAVFEEAAA